MIALFGARAKPAVPALVELLGKKDDWHARYWAAHALAGIGPEARPAVPGLIEATLDKEPLTRAKALQALEKIHPDGAVVAIPFLLKALRDRQMPLRWAAAEGLGRIGPRAKEAVADLARCSDDPDLFVRVSAAEALWRIQKNDQLVPTLLDVMNNPARDAQPARLHAAAALGRIGAESPAVIDALIKVAGDPDRNLTDRHAAMNAIKQIGPPAKAAVPMLIAALKDKRTRGMAVYALQGFGKEAAAAIPALVEALGDPDGGVREYARRALHKIGQGDPDEVRKGLKHEKAWGRVLSARVVWHVATNHIWEALPVLTDALADKEERIACEAAILLGEVGAWARYDGKPLLDKVRPVLPALVRTLDDPRPQVRASAGRAIGAIDYDLYKKLGLKY
jgi:HEAT repeat protein